MFVIGTYYRHSVFFFFFFFAVPFYVQLSKIYDSYQLRDLT